MTSRDEQDPAPTTPFAPVSGLTEDDLGTETVRREPLRPRTPATGQHADAGVRTQRTERFERPPIAPPPSAGPFRTTPRPTLAPPPPPPPPSPRTTPTPTTPAAGVGTPQRAERRTTPPPAAPLTTNKPGTAAPAAPRPRVAAPGTPQPGVAAPASPQRDAVEPTVEPTVAPPPVDEHDKLAPPEPGPEPTVAAPEPTAAAPDATLTPPAPMPTPATPHDALAQAHLEFQTEYYAAARTFNTKAMEFVNALTAGDTTSAKVRRLLLAAMPLATLLVGAAVVMTSLAQDEPWIATGTGAATLALIGIILFLNPLKTVERDVVYRRWSDLVMASYFMRAGNYQAELADLDHAARDADASFALLAASFQKDSAQTLTAVGQALGRVPAEDAAGAADAAGDEGGDDAPADQQPDTSPAPGTKAITLTGPDHVTSVAGTPIAPITIDASGPADLVLAASGQPAGIVFAEGRFTGTPTEPVDDARVTVSASSHAGGRDRRVFASFHWTVTEAPATPE